MAEKTLSTKVGKLFLQANEGGLSGIYWKKPTKQSNQELTSGTDILRKAVDEIQKYLNGELVEFTVPLAPQGTDFQMQVWSELQKIPYGTTISYKELAKRIGNPNACRAVGTANGKNPLSIIVPCHRVIAADSTLGGYAGGLKIKEKLLQIESSQS